MAAGHVLLFHLSSVLKQSLSTLVSAQADALSAPATNEQSTFQPAHEAGFLLPMEQPEKHCKRCDCVKPADEFAPNSAKKDGLQVYCRTCTKSYMAEKQYDKKRWANDRDNESARNRAYRLQNAERLAPIHRAKAQRRRKETPWKVNAANKARKASQMRATPAWADKEQIAIVYRKSAELSVIFGVELQVDHVVPIRGKTVCGLHTHANLQLLVAEENHRKRHYEWPDMP